MNKAMTLVMFYGLFAVVATLVNIGAQILCLSVYAAAYAVELSVLLGTVLGLLTKYLLDKKYIFRFRTTGIGDHSQYFPLYTLTGVGTTLIFWGVEYLFYWIFATDAMRYLGGVIGLTIGYLIKYRLDKRFVFVH